MIAPARARRPGAGRPPVDPEPDPADCPFCAGHEAETPPESFALGPPDRAPDTPGWQLRVVPNLYPAFSGEPDGDTGSKGLLETRPAIGRQEVVVHTPRHVGSLSELDREELRRVAETWQARAVAARSEGFAYVQAIVNEGRAAGASREHSHSQLVWLEREPPAVLGERREQQQHAGGCTLCRLLAEEREAGTRVVAEHDGVVLLSAFAARGPYELLIAPLDCEEDPFESGRLAAAVELLAEALRRLGRSEGPAPANAWVHPGLHWHVELLPRLTVHAGLELGAGLWVNPVSPERAAAALREA